MMVPDGSTGQLLLYWSMFNIFLLSMVALQTTYSEDIDCDVCCLIIFFI